MSQQGNTKHHHGLGCLVPSQFGNGCLASPQRPARTSAPAAKIPLSRADPSGRDNNEAAAALRETDGLEFITTPIGTRKAFGNAAAQGLAASELRPRDAKASQEMERLYRYLYDISEI